MKTAGKTTSRPPAVGSRGDTLYGLKCGICAFGMFMLYVIIKCPSFPEVSGGGLLFNYYLLDYSLGFNARLFIGSIVSLLTRNVTWKFIYYFVLVSIIILCAAFAAWLGRVISGTAREDRLGVTLLFVLLLASSASIAHLLPILNFGRLDLYLTLFVILICVCAPRRRLCWLVPPLCVFAIMTHQLFFLIFMPYIGIIMLYEMYRHGYSKKYVAVFILTVLLSTAAAIYFQFLHSILSPLDFADANEFADHIARTRSIDSSSMPFVANISYFLTLPEHFELIIGPTLSQIWWKSPLCFILSQFPSLCVFFMLWKGSLGDKADKSRRLIGVLCLISPLTLVVTCAVATDWDRWFNLTLFAHFMLAFYLISAGDEAVLSRVRRLGEFFRPKPLLLLAVICYSALFAFSDIQHSPYLFYDVGAIFKNVLSHI